MSYALAFDSERKIDMHGGKEMGLYEKKRGFQNISFGKSAFVESNATKKSLPTKK
jgi:hypothetical protein